MKTILLHGLGQTTQDWEEVINRLASSNVDCPPIFSSIEGEITYAKVLSQLEQTYSKTTEPLRLCGLSLGAVLALDFAIRHGDQVASLVLIAAQYKVPNFLLDFQNFVFHWMPHQTFDRMGISKRNMMTLTQSMQSLDFTDQLSQIACPVTIVCGEKDHANLSAAKKLKALLPQAKLHIIPGAGHEVNQTAPQVLADILNE